MGKVDATKAVVQVRLALKRGVVANSFKMARASGKGAGSYKLVKAEKPKKDKVKKPNAKKPAAKKTTKKAKKASKKTAPKKPEKASKKTAAKKPEKASKKTAAKKPAAKKAAKKSSN